MTKSLPSQPNLEQLKNQAKDLLKSLKSGDAGAFQRIRENHPRWSPASEPEMHATELSLGDAQLVLAREYGFASWPKLKEHVHAVELDTADPMELFKKAFAEHDPVLFRRLLDRHPDLKAKIKAYVESGGLVLASADCGGRGFANSIRKIAGEMFPLHAFPPRSLL